MSKSQSLCMAVISLLFSGMIYLLFRDTQMYMFVPIKEIGQMENLEVVRGVVSNVTLPDWFLYSLPDGLWLYAYMLIIRCVWYNANPVIKYFFLATLPILAICTEILQLNSLCFGTGDVVDLAFYLLFIVLYVLF